MPTNTVVMEDWMPKGGGTLTGAGQHWQGRPLVPAMSITGPLNELVPAPEAPKPERSAFSSALSRSIDEMQGSAAGAVGLVGDLLERNTNWKPLADLGGWLKDWGFNEYLEQMEQAQENAPEVGSLFNIDSPETFFTWMAETAGGLVPSAVTFMASSGAGAIGARAVGHMTAKKLASKQVRDAMKDRASKLVASGLTPAEARKQAVQELVQEQASKLAQRGAMAGMLASSSAIESGSNWTADAEEHGLDNTSPGQDLMFGVASGLTELLGAEASLLRTVFKRPYPKSMEDQVRKSFIKTMAKGIATGAVKSAGEGGQEFVQEMLSTLNANLLRGQDQFSEEDVRGLIDAFAAGAVGGAMFSGVGGAVKHFRAGKALEDESNKIKDKAGLTQSEADLQADITDKVASQLEWDKDSILQKRYENQMFALESQKAELNAAMITAKQQGNAELASELETSLFDVAAQITKLNNKKQTDMALLDRQAKWLRENAARKSSKAAEAAIEEAATGRPVTQVEELRRLSPEQRRTLDAHAQDIESFTSRQYQKHLSRLGELSRNIRELESSLEHAEMGLASTDNFFGTAAERAGKYRELSKKVHEELQELRKQRENETKWASRLFDKAEKASRQLAYLGQGEDYRISSALEDLFSHGNDMSPYALGSVLQTKQVDAANEVDNKFLDRAGAETSRVAMQSRRQARAEEMPYERSSEDDFTRLRREAMSQRQDTSDIMSEWNRVDEPLLTGLPEGIAAQQAIQQDVQVADEFARNPYMQIAVAQNRDLSLDRARELQRRDVLAKKFEGDVYRTKKRMEHSQKMRQDRLRRTYAKTDMVKSWVNDTLNKLPSLKDKVLIVDHALDQALPESIYKHNKNKTDANRSSIKGAWFSFAGGAQRIVLYANHISSQQEAIRVLLHEGVAHYGLRTLFTNQKDLNAFLESVYVTMGDDRLFKEVREQYGTKFEEKNPLALAEEFIAKLAEQVRVGRVLNKDEASVWNKFKSLMRKILSKLGIKSMTRKDINDVLEAVIFNLTKDSNRVSFTHDEISKVRGTKNYLSWRKGIDTVQTSAQQLRDTVSASVHGTDKKTGAIAKHGFLEKGIEKISDQFRRMLTVQRHLKETGGKVTGESNVYRIQETSPNRVEAMKRDINAKFILGKGGLVEMVAKSRDKGDSPAKSFEKVARLAYAMHAKERNKAMLARGVKEGSGLKDAEADAIIKELGQNPYRVAAVKKVHELNEYRLQLLEKHNLFPKEIISEWRKTYEYYVPLKGWEEEQIEFHPGYARTTGPKVHTGDWVPSEFARGRTDLAANPIIQTIRQLHDTVEMVERTRVGRAFLKLVDDNSGRTSLWQREGDVTRGIKTVLQRNEDGSYNLRVKRMSHPFEGKSDQVFTTIDENGKHVRVLVHDHSLISMLRGTNVLNLGDMQPTVLKFIGSLTRKLAVLNTYLNPEFILSNLFRDMQAAAINFSSVRAELREYSLPKDIESQIAKDFNVSQKAIRNALLHEKFDGQWGEVFKKFREYGAFTDYLGMKDFKTLQKEMVDEINAISNEGFTGKGITKMRKVAQYLENQAAVFENMTRLATFKNVSEALMKQGMAEDAAYDRAANIALNLTVNFTKRGSWAPLLNPLYMFANASIQSNARILRTIFASQPGVPFYKRRATKFLVGLTLMPMALGLLGRAVGGEDEDGISYYDKIPQYIKNSNAVIMLPGTEGKYIKIPVALGFNMFTSVGNMLFASSSPVNAPDPVEAALEVARAMFGNFSPIGDTDEGWSMFVPTLFRPMAQIATNKNYFGQPIRPEKQFFHTGEYPASELYWSNCSDIAVAIAKGFNTLTGGSSVKGGVISVSPENIEHVVQSYTGGMGTFLGKILTTATKTIRGEEPAINDLPMVRRFVGENSYYQTLPMYMDAKIRVQTVANEYKAAVESGVTGVELDQIRKSTFEGVRASKQLAAIEKRLKAIRKESRAVQKNLTGSELVEKRKALQEKEDATMKVFLKYMNKREI